MKKKIYLIILLVITILFANCRKKGYDLSKGINTEITVGGDSLTIPLGNTKPVTLGSIVEDESTDILKKSEDGSYSLRLCDTTNVAITAIDPVSFELDPVVISPIETEPAEIVFNDIEFEPVTASSDPITIPNTNLDDFEVPNVNETMSRSFNKEDVFGGNYSEPVQSTPVEFGPYTYQDENQFDINLNFEFGSDLKKVEKVFLKNNIVTVRFDKSIINNLLYEGSIEGNPERLTDYIDNFYIHFPKEYELSINTGRGAQIVSTIDYNSFVINNVALNIDESSYEASFTIDYVDLSSQNQNGSIDFSSTIKYGIDYRITKGYVDAAKLPSVQDISFSIALNASPEIDNLDIVINEKDIENINGTEDFMETISDLPVEVAKIHSLELEPGAKLQLIITDPDIAPFAFKTGGQCVIKLPEFFSFKPYSYLNTNTNILTIPVESLFDTHNLYVERIVLDQEVIDRTIEINDVFEYSVTGLSLRETATDYNSLKSFQDKAIQLELNAVGLSINDATIDTKSISFDIISDNEEEINIDEFVAEEVKKLYSIDLENDAVLQLNILIEGLPDEIDKVYFDNAFIQFPKEFKFRSGDVDSENKVILENGFNVNTGYKKTINLKRIDFGTKGITLTDGILKYNEKISLGGKAYINSTTLNAADIETVIISPSVSISNIEIASIEGIVNPKIDVINEKIELDLPEMLTNEENVFDVVDPVITLEVGNTMGIPIKVDLQLLPKRDGKIISTGVISTELTINAAEQLGEHTWSNFWLAKDSRHVSNGFNAVEIPNLPDLLRTVPDEIELKVTPQVTGEHHKVDLTIEENDIEFRYAVNVPLTFGEDFIIQYRDTIDGLQEGLADFLEMAKQIDIIASVSNQIPLDLDLNVRPLDENGRILEGVLLSSDMKIQSCNIDGTARESNINLGLKETEEGALAYLDALEFTIHASKNTTVAGMPLSEEQSISIGLKVRIPQGIIIGKSNSN